MIPSRFLLVPAAAVAMSVSPMIAAHAQQQQQQQQQQAPAAAEDVSDDELQTYAMASLEVQRISQSYQPQMQSAETADAKEAVQQEALQEMTAAVRDSGLSVQKYNEIATAVRSNPELASQVQQYMQQNQ